jgi:methylmalonyl-CoA carboxyltransferase large subunit
MTTSIENVLADIQKQLAALTERLERVEARFAAPTEPDGQAAASLAGEPARTQEETISEEELLAISAALAAYFGVRVHVRQVRLIGSRAWAQEGRVSIQASHRLH